MKYSNLSLRELQNLCRKKLEADYQYYLDNRSKSRSIERSRSHQDMPMPRLTFFNSKGGTAGWAEGHSEIRISNYFLGRERGDMIDRTMTHEFCHLLDTYHCYGRGHGRSWKNWMTHFNQPLDRCHSYDMSELRPYKYHCPSCLREYNFSKRRHNVVQRGQNQYYCHCRPRSDKYTVTYRLVHGEPSSTPVEKAAARSESSPTLTHNPKYPYLYKCGCRDHNYSGRRHAKVQRGTTYTCKGCGKEPKFDHMQIL